VENVQNEIKSFNEISTCRDCTGIPADPEFRPQFWPEFRLSRYSGAALTAKQLEEDSLHEGLLVIKLSIFERNFSKK